MFDLYLRKSIYFKILLISFVILFEIQIMEAKEDPISTNISWSLNEEGELKLEGKGEMNFRYFPWYDKRNRIRTVVISEGITTIQHNAFEHCGNLEKISLPKTLKIIGNSAFYAGAHRLSSIVIPDSVEIIESHAFCATYGLKTLKIGKSVKYIGDHAFSGCCNKLLKLIIPSSVNFIGGSAFCDCDSLKSVFFEHNENEPISLNGATFSGCKSLVTCRLPLSIERIPSSTFENCFKLTEINIPNKVKSMGAWAFRGCKSITEVVLPSSIEKLSESVFAGSGLRIMYFPNKEVSFNDYSLGGCQELKYLVNYCQIPYNIEAHEDSFYDRYIYKATLVVPDEAVEEYKKMLFWRNFKNVIGLSMFKTLNHIEQNIYNELSISFIDGILKIENSPIGQKICIRDIQGRILINECSKSNVCKYIINSNIVLVNIGGNICKIINCR